MKYDTQLAELKNLLPSAKNILIALPANSDPDKLAAGLSLFLILQAQGKQVSIVCETVVKVSQAYLFGVDHIQNSLSQTEGGNLTITLEGVADSSGTVPALEKLDWFAQNSNLNLVFHVLPGQTFQPARIVPHYQGSGYSLIFVIGAVNLNALGNIYQANQQVFSGVHVINIDTQSANTSFGQTNVLDTNASSVSEMMVNVIADLGFNLDSDSASNLLAGIFDTTGSLTNQKATAETFMAVANCLRAGGRKPGIASPASSQTFPAQDLTPLIPTEPPVSTQPAASPQMEYSGYTTPPVVNNSLGDDSLVSQPQPQPSPEERPSGERVITETPEPDWLTPKIFKGSSLG